MVNRHLVWYNTQTGILMGEWVGMLPDPIVPLGTIGDARLSILNAWLQNVQQHISPDGSVFETAGSVWNLDEYDNCQSGEAVCLDVTMYNWPLGDFVWSMFDGIDGIIDFRSMRKYIQFTSDTLTLHANTSSSRPVQTTKEKLVIDITGTPLEEFHGNVFGRLMRSRGALVLDSSWRDDTGVSAHIQHALETAKIDLDNSLIIEAPRERGLAHITSPKKAAYEVIK